MAGLLTVVISTSTASSFSQNVSTNAGMDKIVEEEKLSIETCATSEKSCPG